MQGGKEGKLSSEGKLSLHVLFLFCIRYKSAVLKEIHFLPLGILSSFFQFPTKEKKFSF